MLRDLDSRDEVVRASERLLRAAEVRDGCRPRSRT